MAKNLDIVGQLFRQGTVLLIPKVEFDTGVSKPKYVVLLEDISALFKRGRILGCMTTSKKFSRKKSWFSVQSATILGLKSGNTTIDTNNRILLDEGQIKKCKYVGQLDDSQLSDVLEAKFFSDIWRRIAMMTGK